MERDNQELLNAASYWFRNTIIKNHASNTTKLGDPSELNVNPLLAPYLSAFLTGSVSEHGIASALVYARVLGTSITTSFGNNIQSFVTDVLGNAFGSVVQGIDIEFVDQTDGRKKWAQLKLGPETINKDDVETIHGHFRTIRNLAQTNKLQIGAADLVIGILSGEEDRINGNYKTLRDSHNYPIFVGQKFWERLTGDERFYGRLISTFAGSIDQVDGSEMLEEVIDQVAERKDVKWLADLN